MDHLFDFHTTLVNAQRLVDRPKGRAVTWKTLPLKRNLRYFLNSLGIGIWKYVSVRCKENVKFPETRLYHTD